MGIIEGVFQLHKIIARVFQYFFEPSIFMTPNSEKENAFHFFLICIFRKHFQS